MGFPIRKFFKYIKWCRQGGFTQATITQISQSQLLQGQRALVTGGSDGIGLAIAQKFISTGAEVVITGRNEAKLQEAARRINSNKLHTLQWDISSLDSLPNKLLEANKLMGGIDILVNNAAMVTIPAGNADRLSAIIDTNIKAVYLMCQEIGQQMANQGRGGKIINISSLNAYQCGTHPYFMTKRAVNAITEGFAKQLAPHGVIVNGIAPGFCNSNINKQTDTDNIYRAEPLNHRLVLPEEIAELALFLCSNAANAIIGQTILCDGGATLK